MFVRKSTVAVMILAQAFFGLNAGIAIASTAITQTTVRRIAMTPELVLLQNAIALEGMNLSASALKFQLTSEITRYAQTAIPQGQPERLRQALVDLRIYTPAQASAFVSDAQVAARSGTAVGSELASLMSMHPEGAQFSWCALGGGILAGVSGFVILLGVTVNGISNSQPLITNRIFLAGSAGMAAAVTAIILGATGDC